MSPKNSKKASVTISNGALDLRMRRESHGSESTTTIDISEEEKENRLLEEHPDHEDIVCAPSIPLILSTSSTCTTPSPVPSSPELHTNVKFRNTSPKTVITMASSKTTKKLTNGVVQNCVKPNDVDNKKSELYQNQTTAGSERNTNFNLTEMLLAAATKNSDALKELQFSSEMMPHLPTIPQANSTKRPALNPIANIPLLLPHVPPGSRVIPDLLNPSILPLLTSELAMRLATTNVQASMPQYVRQGKFIFKE